MSGMATSSSMRSKPPLPARASPWPPSAAHSTVAPSASSNCRHNSRMRGLVVHDQHAVAARAASGSSTTSTDSPTGRRGQTLVVPARGLDEREQGLHDRRPGPRTGPPAAGPSSGRRPRPVPAGKVRFAARTDGGCGVSRRVSASTGFALERERQLAGQAPEQRRRPGRRCRRGCPRCWRRGPAPGPCSRSSRAPCPARSAVAEVPRQAEVEQLGLVLGRDQDVGRLDVAVDQAVACASRPGRRPIWWTMSHARRRRQRPAVADELFQVLRPGRTPSRGSAGPARPGRVVDPAGVDGGDDVRVPQPGDGPHLGVEAGSSSRSSLVGRAAAP